MMEFKTTNRGFSLIEFSDCYGAPCNIQKSSLATEDAIWFGVADADPKVMASTAAAHGVDPGCGTGWVPFPVPQDVLLNTRMHLTRDQVAALIPYLQHFVSEGEIPSSPIDADAVSLTETDVRMLYSVGHYLTMRDDSPKCGADLSNLAERIKSMLTIPTASGAIGQSLLRPAISATNPLPPGCYCEPGRCAAPRIMGRQTACRDPAKRDSPAKAVEGGDPK